jgi:hypothetical protein
MVSQLVSHELLLTTNPQISFMHSNYDLLYRALFHCKEVGKLAPKNERIKEKPTLLAEGSSKRIILE